MGANFQSVVSAMDVSGPWSLDPTTLCVSVVVIALGGLWLYVMLGRPSRSPASEYQRLEALLSEPDVKKGVRGNSGKKKGKGRNRTVSRRWLTRSLHASMMLVYWSYNRLLVRLRKHYRYNVCTVVPCGGLMGQVLL